jgi:hypothetical protein
LNYTQGSTKLKGEKQLNITGIAHYCYIRAIFSKNIGGIGEDFMAGIARVGRR